MSSCGINRHKPGGRVVGNVCVKGSGMTDSELDGKFAALMASRKAMDETMGAVPTKSLSTPALQTLSQQLAVVSNPTAGQTTKKTDIDIILQGDLLD